MQNLKAFCQRSLSSKKSNLRTYAIAILSITFLIGQISLSETTTAQEKSPDNSGWAASISDALNRTKLTSQQKQTVIQINTYLNKLTDLKGRFLQVNPDDSQQKGKFYLKRPGRIRFDYSPPSLQRIMSDGKFLIIEDRDINTVDKFPLKNTPFRILLAAQVNIVRDAFIKNVIETDELTSIILIDRNGSAIGQIELVFTKDPIFELKEWKVIDTQGQTTRVILSHLNFSDKIDKKLFIHKSETKLFGFP